MAIDFKNIVFKYIKITGGTASIDTLMTDKIFDTTKPQGVYKCFIFPNREFGGIDYSDLQNLVSIEKINMWDRIDRSAFMGFNAETNEFIVNHSAWLSSQDSDLKTDGSLEHSGQVGWFTTTINTTKGANSKYEIIQTDGSKAYLELKPIKIEGTGSFRRDISEYPACIENEQKSILGSVLYKKEDALFAKCADDNSIVMVHDCVPSVVIGSYTTALSRSNKEYGYRSRRDEYVSSYKFGKKIFSFSTTTSINPINAYANAIIKIKNTSSSTNIELTYTSDINDILSSGEALTFFSMAKQKSLRYIYSKKDSSPYVQPYIYSALPEYTTRTDNSFSLYSDKATGTPSCDLISCDSRKPFVYTPTNIIVSEFSAPQLAIDALEFIKDIPDGVIILVASDSKIIRYKKGDPVKSIKTSVNGHEVISIDGATMFGTDLYDSYNDKFRTENITKDDVINATGFTDITTSDSKTKSSQSGSTFLVTVYKI